MIRTTGMVGDHRFNNQVGSSKPITPSSSVILDTATTVIALPKTDCDNIYSELPGEQLNFRYGVYTLGVMVPTSSPYTG